MLFAQLTGLLYIISPIISPIALPRVWGCLWILYSSLNLSKSFRGYSNSHLQSSFSGFCHKNVVITYVYPTYFPPPSEENSGGQDKFPVFKFLLVQLICCCFLSFSAATLNMKCIFTELEKPMTKEGWFFSFFLESCLLPFTHNCFENFLCCLLINLTISKFICSSSSHSQNYRINRFADERGKKC